MKKIVGALICLVLTCSCLSQGGSKNLLQKGLERIDTCSDLVFQRVLKHKVDKKKMRNGAQLVAVGAACFGIGGLAESFRSRTFSGDPFHMICGTLSGISLPIALIAAFLYWRYDKRCKSTVLKKLLNKN